MLNVGLVTHAKCGAEKPMLQCRADYPCSMWGWLPMLNVGLVTQAKCKLIYEQYELLPPPPAQLSSRPLSPQ